MDYIIDASVAIFMVSLGVAVMTLTNFTSSFLKVKSNESFDVARNRKVSAILDLVELNIATAITNYLSNKNYAEMSESELREAAEKIRDSVTKITGEGVINFVVETFTDNWDEWIIEKIIEAMVRKAKYEVR